MPRRQRLGMGGMVFHVLNRSARRARLFDTAGDYVAVEQVLCDAALRVPMRVLSYVIMPNHWHLVLWPAGDWDLSLYMKWFTQTHAQRWHVAHGSAGTGALYQGRFKAFPIQADDHFLTVCRYVERNPVRAGLVRRAADWRWGSANRSLDSTEAGRPALSAWPVRRPASWQRIVDDEEPEASVEGVRTSVVKSTPYGTASWSFVTTSALGLASLPQSASRLGGAVGESEPARTA